MPGPGHVHASTPLFDLYAEHARQASGADLSQRCAVCRWYPLEWERVADVPGGGIVHVALCAERRVRAGKQAA